MMKKRMLSLALVILLVLTVLPVTALAEETYELYVEIQLDGMINPEGFHAYGAGSYPAGTEVGLAVSMPEPPHGYVYVFDGWSLEAGLVIGISEPEAFLTSYLMPYCDEEIYAMFHMETASGEVSDPEDVFAPLPELDSENHIGYINGYEDGTIRPDQKITRAEVAALLYRLMTFESRKAWYSTDCGFADVAADAWYCDAVATLHKAGILSGYSETLFAPDKAITRAEFAALLVRFTQAQAVGTAGFTDVSSDHWAADAIALCKELHWINGYADGTFRPEQSITRAETAAMLNRVLNRTCTEWEASARVWKDLAKDAWYYTDLMEACVPH